jgi:hypothetical protein
MKIIIRPEDAAGATADRDGRLRRDGRRGLDVMLRNNVLIHFEDEDDAGDVALAILHCLGYDRPARR